MMSDNMFKRKLKRMKKRGERWKKIKELQDMYAPYAPAHKKRKVSNVMLTIVVIAILGYTVAAFWLAHVNGVVIDSTLTTCFYTFWGSELFLLAGLKGTKVFKGSSDENHFE